jgi:tRNA wybutosine-synthesizing protein 2
LPADFAAALWVSTTQNGLRQVWAPRHTMFSRGNVKEKARILGFASGGAPDSASATATAGTGTRTGVGSRSKWAVDLYAGIGYFAFSYARLGLRVLCWELNPWSVEGLRRGAEANGFSVRIVRAPPPSPKTTTMTARGIEGEGKGEAQGASSNVGTDWSWDGDGDGDLDLVALLGEEEDGEAPQIVVFLEDNRLAAGRIRRARAAGVRLEVVHVNCGFLPSSEGVWRDAWEIQTGGGGSCAGAGEGVGWLHLHENVGAADIERRKADVQGLFDRWKQQDGNGSTATVEHVELVKTYAPGVWHCVFDVCITRSNAAE